MINQKPAEVTGMLHKTSSLYFKEHCTKIDDILLVVIPIFLSQTNLIIKFDPVLIGILDRFHYSIFTILTLRH